MTSTKRRIPVVDDSELTCRVVSSSLLKCGCDVVTADDNEGAGLSKIELNGKGRPVYGALLDLHTPCVNGISVLQQLGDGHPGLPVIVIADPDNGDEVWEAMRRGAQDFLIKPLTATFARHEYFKAFIERDNPD